MDDLNRRGALRLAAGCMALSLFAASGAALAEDPLEREVKAAYLYKFGSFVEWPEASFARPDSPLQIGVAGDDALADQLVRTVTGRSVAGRPIAVPGRTGRPGASSTKAAPMTASAWRWSPTSRRPAPTRPAG